MLDRTDLHNYQCVAVDFLRDRPAAALWIEMGLGKTASTLTAVADLFEDFAVRRVLVIGPKRVALTVWSKEASIWAQTKHLTVNVAVGTAKQRVAAIEKPSDIVTINRENVRWLVEQYHKNWPFDCVVIDEASSFKDRSSGRFRALKAVRPKIERIYELTGTPGDDYLQLWSQIYLLDGGKRLGRSFTAYRDAYFYPVDFNGYNWALKPGAKEKIEAAIADIVLSMKAEGLIELPERVDNYIRVQLPAGVMRQYAAMERALATEIEEGKVTAANAAVKTGKLRQIANGGLYLPQPVDEEGKPVGPVQYSTLHDAKLEALDEIVEAQNGQPLFVAYEFEFDRDAILSRYKQAVFLDSDPETIARWNRGELEILIAHPASAGHGLNLQQGGSTICWYGLTWSLELYQQFCARLHRQGQKADRVVMHHIIAEGTIDELVVARLAEKGESQEGLLAALRADLQRRAA